MAEIGKTNYTIQVGNLSSLRTIADVRDAVIAYYKLVTIKPQFGESYNIGGEKTLKVGEILDFLISLSSVKKKFKIIIDKNRLRPIDADLQIPDCTKFKNHTGWKPTYKFEETLEDLLNFEREDFKFIGIEKFKDVKLIMDEIKRRHTSEDSSSSVSTKPIVTDNLSSQPQSSSRRETTEAKPVTHTENISPSTSIEDMTTYRTAPVPLH